jgi:hypothetical protein
VSERIQSIVHHGKKVIVLDLAKGDAEEVERTVRQLPDVVTAEPAGSALILGDFTGAAFDEEAIRAMQQAAVFDKAFVKKSAWVGPENPLDSIRKRITGFSRREFLIFKTRQEALDWLTEE